MKKILLILILAALFLGFCLAEPDFLLDRFYERIYADRLAPAPEALLNETPVSFELTGEEWSFQKNNGRWYAPPPKPGKAGAEDSRSGPASAGDSQSGPDSAGDSRSGPAAAGDSRSGPAAVVTSEEDSLTVAVAKAPDRASLKIIESDSGQVVLEDQADLSGLPLPGRNGSFTYELTLEWTGEARPYRGNSVLAIPVTVDLPARFVFSAQQLAQGQLLEVTVYYADRPEDIVFRQSIYSKFQWYREDGLLRGYLPTNYNVKPGVYQIDYGIKSKGTENTLEIEIAAYPYHIQYLKIDPKTEQETRNDAAYAEYNKYYIPVRSQSEPARYYTESFTLPVRGRLTTEFGETRYVNDFPTSYRHLGLDIAAPEETEVKAANRGKVVLARFFTLTGNTVMIDHGEGLFSVYHHLLNLSVKTGEIAEREQKIGEVGSTGFSTGPHLHFMISHYMVNLEPGYFLVGQPITYENYKDLIQ